MFETISHFYAAGISRFIPRYVHRERERERVSLSHSEKLLVDVAILLNPKCMTASLHPVMQSDGGDKSDPNVICLQGNGGRSY